MGEVETWIEGPDHEPYSTAYAYAPTAGPGEDVREQIARALWDWTAVSWSDDERREMADAVLAVPSIAGALAERDALREFAEWALSIADDPPQRRTVTLEQVIQRAALACDPELRRALGEDD